jgi:hypothetical protein
MTIATLIATGCTTTQTWQASESHGDKPGTGFKLKVANERVVSGSFHLLDPEHPHDFHRGRSVPIRILAIETNVVRFEFNLGPTHKEVLSLRLLGPLKDKPVEADLLDEGGPGVPNRLRFIPAGRQQ